jgi:hypothetical protein
MFLHAQSILVPHRDRLLGAPPHGLQDTRPTRGERIAFSPHGDRSRGLGADLEPPLETGGFLVGKKVTIELGLEVEAVRAS